jgi:Retinoblastoma-associated protein B domain
VLQGYAVLRFLTYERTGLFFGRHLDQMILAAVYATAKVRGFHQVPAGRDSLLLPCTAPRAWQPLHMSRSCPVCVHPVLYADELRACDAQISFKEILEHYRKMPQARSQTYRKVPLLQDAGALSSVYCDEGS